MKHKDKILKEILSNEAHLAFYNEGILSLEKSRLFEFLRAAHVPELIQNGANVHMSAASAAFSAGYSRALDDIMDFREFLEEYSRPKAAPPRPDYGGLDLAVENKHLTKEEADAIRRGHTIRYDPRTGELS